MAAVPCEAVRPRYRAASNHSRDGSGLRMGAPDSGASLRAKRPARLAISELRKASDLSHQSPLMVSALAHAYALSGNQAKAQELLTLLFTESRKQYVSPFYIGVVYAGLAKNDAAMD